RAKALALVGLIANPKDSPYRGTNMIWERFLGGSEEEVIKKGWHMCNEISRALAFLCQVAGLPARPVFIFTDPVYFAHGHAQTEIFFDGKWNLVEQNHGLLYLKPDGYFASTVELRNNPDIVNSRADAGSMLALCSCCFTAPTAIIQYRIDDVSRYNYLWQDMKYLEYRCSGFDYYLAYSERQLPDNKFK
ncbi:MAG: transglutaminase domain-containing protein, partial [Victivallales bacterium]|nr:transglutaminase domain-containing protein [Victivallales bacterium]